MTTDPIANMIISLKNAALVEKDTVVVPFSGIKLAIARCLEQHGYLASSQKKTEKKNKEIIEMKLKMNDGAPAIHEVKRVSKPSRRVYKGVKELASIKNGFGMLVLSTPKGILSDKDAKKEQVGGEALFMIW
jgi:small subunit ribosomal protein S8